MDNPTATGIEHSIGVLRWKDYTIGAPTVEVYDFDSASWSSGPDYPRRSQSSGHMCTIYVSTIVCTGGAFVGNAWSLELSDSTPQWRTLPSLSDSDVPRMTAHDGYIYVIAGYCSHFCYASSLEVLDLRDPTSLASTSASIPSARLAPLCTSAI